MVKDFADNVDGSTSAPCYQDVIEELRTWLKSESERYSEHARDFRMLRHFHEAENMRGQHEQCDFVLEWLNQRLASEPKPKS